MPKSAYQLFKEKVDPKQIGNVKLRQALMKMYDQNYRQQLEQVNANYQAGLAQGLTPGQAATTWVLPNGPNSKYTVKDGQTLPDVAKAAGTTPADIVNANPQMTNPQTGMVLKIPQPDFTGVSGMNGTQYGQGPRPNQGTQQYNKPAGPQPTTQSPFGQPQTNPFAPQGQNNAFNQKPTGGTGLPSNAAQGATTTNPQGTNPMSPTGSSGLWNQFTNAYNNSMTQNSNPFAPQNPGRNVQGGGFTTPAMNTPITGVNPNALPGPKGAPISPMPNIPPNNLSPIFAQKLQTGDLTPEELKYAVQKGWVAPSNKPQTQTQGMGIAFPKGNKNYSFWTSNRGKTGKSPTGRGGGGGGGGNGGGVQPRYTQDNLPAFSSGSGFGGLVNWRV